MKKFLEKYEEQGLTLEDIVDSLAIILSPEDVDDEAEREDLLEKAYRYLWQVYEIACETKDDKEL